MSNFSWVIYSSSDKNDILENIIYAGIQKNPNHLNARQGTLSPSNVQLLILPDL